jgi:hypothetical protein
MAGGTVDGSFRLMCATAPRFGALSLTSLRLAGAAVLQ